MKTIIEPGREIPVLAEADVLVVGSGPGGLSAAIAAARTGADVLLVEEYGCFGGNLTQVGVQTIGWYDIGACIDSEGICRELEARAKQYGAAYERPNARRLSINGEAFKYAADRIVIEEGIRPLLHCKTVAAVMEGNTIGGIVTESKSGRQAVLAKRVIDATGDADVAVAAGAETHKTPVDEMLGVTVVFSCSGVNKEKFLAYVNERKPRFGDWGKNWSIRTDGKEDDLFCPYLEEEFNRAQEKGIIPKGIQSIGGTFGHLTEHGEATYLNMLYMMKYDATSVEELTRAEMDGRQLAMWAIAALKSEVPGFENATLRDFGMKLGVRDTRKIVSRGNLTGDDVFGQARFADTIGIFPEFIDGYEVLFLPTTGRYFQIPYGILLPKSVENLLVAGRCVGGDKMSHAATRNMMCCAVTGQAAGTAAALSLRENVTPGALNVALLQKELVAQGARIN
ncbi:MAG: FAD-dependent oxidoreductase [Rhizobiaceae bacterium]|nr:MAG: FAD-dependent oxidoreductase [Rhizobiaceae bacterium]